MAISQLFWLLSVTTFLNNKQSLSVARFLCWIAEFLACSVVTSNYCRDVGLMWRLRDVRYRSLSSIRTTSPEQSFVGARRRIRSFAPMRRASFLRTSRRWYWPLTTTITRSYRCSCRAIIPSRGRIRSPASAPTAWPSRTTTHWSVPGHVSTRTERSPVPHTWRCPVPTPSWPPSSCAKKWRNWRRSRRSLKLVNIFHFQSHNITYR